MKKEHLNLITEYSKGSISKDSLRVQNGENYVELLDSYLNDLNSSRLRQDITCNVIGLSSNEDKLGYDGNGTNDEVKPSNISTKGKKKSRLGCKGSYSDLTHKRHKKYIEDDAIIHISGFIDGFLMFIFRLPYRDLQNHFQLSLDKILPNGDIPNRYLRSASFGFKQIKSCPNLQLEFSRHDIENYASLINKDLYNYIKSVNNG